MSKKEIMKRVNDLIYCLCACEDWIKQYYGTNLLWFKKIEVQNG